MKNHFFRMVILFFVVFLLAFILVRDSGCLNTVQQEIMVNSFQNDQNNPVYPFPVGEKITFGVYSNGIKVGNGSLLYQEAAEVKAGSEEHIVFSVSSFMVKDTDHVYGDFQKALPFRVQRAVRVAGRQEEIVEQYGKDNKSVVIQKTDKKGAVSSQTISSNSTLNNVLLLLYRLRIDEQLSVGKTYMVNLPTQTFTLTVKDKRKIKVPLGVFDAFYLESLPPKYKIWLADDARRTPLRLQGVITPGIAYLATIDIQP